MSRRFMGILAAVAVAATAQAANAGTLTGSFTIYDQTSGTYGGAITETTCSAQNGSCYQAFTPTIAQNSSGSGGMSWSVTPYTYLVIGDITYNRHFTYPDGVQSIAACEWEVRISRANGSSPWNGTTYSYSTADTSVNYIPACTVGSLSVDGGSGNFSISVTFANN